MINFNHIKDLTINNQSVTQIQIGSNIIWKKNVEPTDEWEEYKISQVGWTVDLYNQWQIATVRQDADTNFQTYQSYSNKGVHNSWARMKVNIAAGISQFTLHYGSYAENGYDYTLIGKLDVDMSTNTQTTSSDWVGNSKSSQSASAPNLSYTYTIADTSKEHFVWIAYYKDGSTSSSDDRGYVSFDKRIVSEFDGWRKKEKTYFPEETSPYVYEFYLGERWVYSEDKQTIIKEDPITATTQQLPTQLVDGEDTDTFIYGRYVYYKKYYQVNLNGVWIDTNLFTFGDVARELQLIELEYVASQSTATTPVFDIEYKYGMDYTFEMECIETTIDNTERRLLDSPSTTERYSPFEFVFYNKGRYLDYHSPISSSSNLCTNGDYDNRQMITSSTYSVSGETNLQTYQLKVSNTTLTHKLLVNGSQKYNSATTISSTSGKWFDGNYKNRLQLYPNKYFKSFKVYDNNSTLVNNYVFVLKEDDNKVYLLDKATGTLIPNQKSNSTYSYIFKSTPINVEYQMSDLVYTNTVDAMATSSTINFTGTTINTYESGFIDRKTTTSSQTITYAVNTVDEPVVHSGNVTWNGLSKPYSITQSGFDITRANVIAYNANDNIIWGTYSTTARIPDAYKTLTYKAYISDNVTKLPSSLFDNFVRLTSVGIKGSGASVEIPNSVTSIGSMAFHNCTSLTSVTIPDSVTSIDGSAFHNCTSLTSVTIPDSVTSIGNDAFYGCSKLSSVTIGNDCTTIGDTAFNGCSALTTVSIGSALSSIGNGAFLYCPKLNTITLSPENTTYHLDGMCLMKGGQIVLGTNTSVIPSTATSIANRAFATRTSLQTATIPETVTTIDYGAFWQCSGLTSVTLPSNITAITSGMLQSCSSLTYVNSSTAGECNIPDKVTKIDTNAFINDIALTTINIPDSCTLISGGAFANCTKLQVVNFGNTRTTVPTLANNNAFLNSNNSNRKIIVPDVLYDSWITKTNWNTTTNNIKGSIIKYSEFYNT